MGASLSSPFREIFIVLTFLFVLSCGGGGEEGSGTGETFESGECAGFCGEEEIAVSVDLSGAKALFTVETTDGASASLIDLPDATGTSYLTTSTSSPLFAVTNDGIKAILTALDPAGENTIGQLPRLSFIAVSPIGEVVLAFEHAWIYRNETEDGITLDQYADPWAPSSPFTCQIFVVHELIGEAAASSDETSMNLTCLKNDIEINTWDQRTKQIQFDEDGNAYFAGHVPGNWKDLLYKYTTKKGSGSADFVATIPEDQLAEKINANICFRRFLVTRSGGVLYTGVTAGGGGDCHGDEFFRYITPENNLIQVTSGWWDFTFAPIEDNLENGTVANDFYLGQILFYGPDPLVATTPQWDDSCLFRFDPNASGSDRSTRIADCNIDIWRYINFDDDDDANADSVRQSRCEEQKNMMGGGNQPKKILLADNQDSDGLNEIYMVGDIYEKKISEWRCNLCTNGVPASYCVVGETLHFEATTAGACTTAGGTFVTTQKCYNDQIDATSTGNVCNDDALPANWEINHEWCEFSDSSRSTRSAVARVDENFDGGGNNRIVRLSEDNEIVENGWAVGNRLAYLTFDVDVGDYELREEGKAGNLIDGIEVYELIEDPRNLELWFFNGLRFSDNQYVLGTFDPDADNPEDTLSIESGLTGQIDTLVIVSE